jgi:hypothetical protein
MPWTSAGGTISEHSRWSAADRKHSPQEGAWRAEQPDDRSGTHTRLSTRGTAIAVLYNRAQSRWWLPGVRTLRGRLVTWRDMLGDLEDAIIMGPGAIPE